MTNVRALADRYFGLDIRSLALMRIALGAVALADLAVRLKDWRLFYGSQGLMPLSLWYAVWHTNPWVWSLHTLWGGPPLVLWTLFTLQAIAAACLIAGYRTRVSTIVLWFLLLSLDNADPLILNAGDGLMLILLLIAIFLPLGETFSVDRVRTYAPPRRTRVVSLWSAALFLQFACFYFFASLLKNPFVWVAQGTGVYQALSLDGVATHYAPSLLAHSHLVTALSYAVYGFQHLVPFLLFFPIGTPYVRAVTLLCLGIMHLSFTLFLTIGLFSWITLAGLTGLIPSFIWERSWRWQRTRLHSVNVYYDGECGFCRYSSHFLYVFLALPASRIGPAQEDASILADMRRANSWVVVGEDGTRHFEFDAFIELLAASPLWFWFAPVARLSLLARIGKRTYRLVADHRPRMRMPEMPTSVVAPTRREENVTMLLGVVFIIIMLVSNLKSVDIVFRFYPYTWIGNISTSYGQLEQNWALFTMNTESRIDGWPVVAGYIHDGRTVDLFRGGRSLTFAKPPDIADIYPGEHWHKYVQHLFLSGNVPVRVRYAEVLCQRWNEAHGDPSSHLDTIDIFFMQDPIPPPGTVRGTPQKRLALSAQCP